MAKRIPSSPPVIPGLNYIRLLGTGGFSDVFLYEQDMPRRQVAVKVMLSNTLSSAQLSMFHAEADLLARLSSHPSILTIFQASIASDGRPYFVMEYCPTSLSPRYRKEVIPLAEVLDTAVKIGSAVETVHRAGILHRDIKPSNILMTSFGAPVLSDFGIAMTRVQRQDQFFAMSLPWSAPEVVTEQTTGTVAAEVWAFGATIYSLLASRSPFELAGSGKNTREALSSRIIRAKFQPMARHDVPNTLERTVGKCMAKDPDQRYRSVAEATAELQQIQKQLDLPVTAFETGVDAWTAESRRVELGDTQMRGPIRSTVPVQSDRRKRMPEQNHQVSDEQIVQESRSSTLNKIWWMLGGAAAASVMTLLIVFLTRML